MLDKQSNVSTTDRLLIRYEISLDGKVLEGGVDEGHHQYTMGAGQWPEQIEAKMLGLKQSEEIKLDFTAADKVFGDPDPERIVQMSQSDFASIPCPGELIEFELPDGQVIEGQVLSMFNDSIEVDFNHPYAGRDISIQICIESIICRSS